MAALQSEQVLQETPLPCTCMPQTDTLFLFTRLHQRSIACHSTPGADGPTRSMTSSPFKQAGQLWLCLKVILPGLLLCCLCICCRQDIIWDPA